ncbi:MAG: NAD-dependent epimerase/dehydratase family protein [Gemmatimonadetes bacterium]|nr:NAD-dependent epimerase/dehydratase family protein [Gemmatimonadota bacterium]
MRVLLTGGTGFVGSHVAEALLAAGHRVRCLVRRPHEPGWLGSLAVELADGSLDGRGLEAAAHGVEAVVHVAGRTRGTRRELWEANVRGTARLLDASARRAPGARFVFISSQAAAGPTPAERSVSESDAPRPVSAYGKSKLEAEHAVLNAQGLTPIVLRPVAVYGPRDRDSLPFFRHAARGRLFVPGHDGPRVHLVHARDVARAVLLALERDAALGATLFIGHPRPCGWADLRLALEAACGHPIRAVSVPRWLALAVAGLATLLGLARRRPGVLDWRRAQDLYGRWLCDVRRAETLLGWRAEVDLENGFKETVAWYRSAGWL